MAKLKKYRTFLFLLVLLFAWAALFAVIDPQEAVEKIGVENTYLVAFLIAVFGGLSTITGSSFFLAVATFASSGSNPLLLALTGGLGIFISDTVFFLVAKYGVKALQEKTGRISRWLTDKFERWPTWAILGLVFIYISFTPLPNDLLMIALALYGVSYKRLAPVLLVGSFLVVLVSAYLGGSIFEAIF